MFTLTDCDEYGYTFIVETFPDVDSACDALNSLQLAQDCAYSYTRELAIAELSDQLANYQELPD